MCDVTPARVDEVSRESSWLQPAHRKSPWQALLAAPKVSPLFSAPFVGVDCIQMDWLHVVDIGVALQFLGSLFKVFMAKFPGNADEQSRQLFRLIQDYYVSSNAHSRLDELKPSMIKDPKKKFPKLRAKAGEARCLVPFAPVLAGALKETEAEHSMYLCAVHFSACYEQLSAQSFDATALAAHGNSFAALYVGLRHHFEALELDLFKVTPKLHLFCELTYRAMDCPSCHWSYRDEDWGGKMACVAASRGGKNSPQALGTSFFQRFTSNEKVPTL